MDLNTLLIDQPNPVKLFVKALNVDGVNITGGGGNPNSLVSSNPLVAPVVGSVVVFTGDGNNFDCNSQEILVVDTITNTIKINDASSSEWTSITTNGATYINHNGGSSGLVLDAGTGDLTLTNTKLSGVVNVNSFSGLQFNGVGLINNSGSDLRMFNADGDTIIESKLNNVKLISQDLKYFNLSTEADYRVVPTAQPSNNSIVEYQANGECAFIPTPSGGATNGILNTSYPTDAPANSLVVFSGVDAVSASPSSLLTADSNNLNLTSTPPILNLYNTNDNNVWGFITYLNDGSFLIDNQDNNAGTENTIKLGKVDTEINTTQTGGQITLNSGNVVNLKAPLGTKIDTTLRIVGPSNTGFIEGTLLMDANENFQISSGSGLGGNIVFSGTGNTTIRTQNGLSIIDPSSDYSTVLNTNNAGDFSILDNNGDITLNAGTAYFKSVKTNNNGVVNKVQNCQAYAVAGCPVSPALGECFFCLDIIPPRPLWFSGVSWVDATGLAII